MTGTPLYGPAENLRRAAARGAQLLAPVTRAIDAFDRRIPRQGGIEQPALPLATPVLAPARAVPAVEPTDHSPARPLPGTTGAVRPAISAKRP